MTLKLDIVDDEGSLAACVALRRAVFVDEQGVPEELEIDGRDGQFQHVLVTKDGRPAGTARFRMIGDAVKIQSVCVDPARRGEGIGALIIKHIMEQAPSMGAASVTLSAQETAFGFYERLGYEAQGEIFMDAGIPHQTMVCKLGVKP